MLSRRSPCISASFLLFLASLAGSQALTSCDDDSARLAHDDLLSLVGTWSGSYLVDEDPLSSGGSILLDLEPDGSGGVAGRVLVFPEQSDDGGLVFMVTASRTGDTFHLSPDQGPVSLSMTGSLTGTTLSGGLTLVPHTADGVFMAGRIPDGNATVTSFLSLPASHVRSMVFMSTTLWISTLGEDFVLASPAGALVDTVAVFYDEDIHWTSDVLAWDGERMWGHLPSAATGRPTWSRLYPFTGSGIEGEGLITPHLSSGLAFDGNKLWSLDGASDKLYEVDRTTAAVVDSIDVTIPDLIHLEFFENHFWGMGWYTRKIYKIDLSGNVVAVFDISAGEGAPFPLGITSDGESLYFSQSAGNGSIIHRMTPQTGS